MYNDDEVTLIKLRKCCCNTYQIKVENLFSLSGVSPSPPPFFFFTIRVFGFLRGLTSDVDPEIDPRSVLMFGAPDRPSV